MITLLDDRVINPDEVTFNRNIYHFTYRGEDITNLIRRADKRAMVDNFDDDIENQRLYVEKYVRENGVLPPEVGSTSTWAIFFDQLATDPLDAPLDALDTAVEKAFSSSGFRTLAIIGGLLVVVVLVVAVKK